MQQWQAWDAAQQLAVLRAMAPPAAALWLEVRSPTSGAVPAALQMHGQVCWQGLWCTCWRAQSSAAQLLSSVTLPAALGLLCA